MNKYFSINFNIATIVPVVFGIFLVTSLITSNVARADDSPVHDDSQSNAPTIDSGSHFAVDNHNDDSSHYNGSSNSNDDSDKTSVTTNKDDGHNSDNKGDDHGNNNGGNDNDANKGDDNGKGDGKNDGKDCPPNTHPTNTPPVITLLGANPLNLTVGQTFVDPGATATDTEDGNLTSHIVETGTVTASTTGTYILTYSVTDSGGLSASTTRQVIVSPATCTSNCGGGNGGGGNNSNFNINVIASKIVCNSESDLPNWGNGGPNITASTTSAFLSSHSNCHLQPDWDFQWANSNATDPGSTFIGEASGWTTFGPTNTQGLATTQISLASGTPYIWMREVLKNGYIPFTYSSTTPNNNNPYSAEMYCHTDVLNYDNYDRVDGPVSGGTYYCVAFNALKTGTTTPPVNTPPVITLLGANPLNLTVGQTFVDPGATATDTEDGNLTSHIVETGTVTASTTGTYILTYSVTDSGGLSASTTRQVIVSPATCTSNCGGGGGNTTGADISVTKTVNESTANVGDTLTYIVSVVNNGPQDATGVTVTDVLPSGLTFVSATSTSGSYSTTTGIWTIGNLTNSASTTLTILATVNSGTEGTTIINTANASSTQNDPNTSNNTINVNVNVPATVVTTGGGCNSNCGGGGGGGGISTGQQHPIQTQGQILGATSCFYLRDYLKIGWQNDPIEVLKLQSFLNVFEGEHLSLTGIFDQTTFDAVQRFQIKYSNDILAPWGPKVTTGFVYILTKKKVNEIYCDTVYPLNQSQKDEINLFRNSGASTYGAVGQATPTQSKGQNLTVGNNGSTKYIPVSGVSTSSSNSSVIKNLAVSIFSSPSKIFGNNKHLAILLILIALVIIIGAMFVGSDKDDGDTNIPSSNLKDNNHEPIKKENPPVVVLPGGMPDEEIIIDNPEEQSEEIIS